MGLVAGAKIRTRAEPRTRPHVTSLTVAWSFFVLISLGTKTNSKLRAEEGTENGTDLAFHLWNRFKSLKKVSRSDF